MEEVQKGKHTGIIQTAAASQVGRMIITFAQEAKIPLINIVRNEDQLHLLKCIGAKTVLNVNNENFENQLFKECKRQKTTLAFDAVGGALSGLILSAMPQQSEIIVYGALSDQNCSGFSPMDLIFHKKKVQGFWLKDWILQSSFFKILRSTQKVQNKMLDGTLQTLIRRKVPLSEAKEALLDYQREMTLGKVIINFIDQD